jgi:predicted membrane chloride channel (bestrophin family)
VELRSAPVQAMVDKGNGTMRTIDGESLILPDTGQAYSEAARPYRRSVFFHENWVKHRSKDRYRTEMATFFDSGVIRGLSTEILGVTGIAAAVIGINMLIGGYDDLSMVHHAAPFPVPLVKDFSLPALPFQIAMPALSLLLVFRTNTAYFRWNEARTLWGGIVNTTRNLQRQSNFYFAKEDTELREQLTREVALFPKALRSFLRGADDDEIFRGEATKLVGPETADAIMASKNRQTFVTNMISATVHRANLNPMDRARMDDNVCKLVDQLGACERIFRSPIPLVYTRHTARFLTSFMLLLPLALWQPMSGSWNHWALIPATGLLATFFFGIEELGIQIEEPFGILPLESLCDTSIGAVVNDMQDSYKKGHFGELLDDDRKPYEGEWRGTVEPTGASSTPALHSLSEGPETDASSDAGAPGSKSMVGAFAARANWEAARTGRQDTMEKQDADRAMP